jgi:hypothetical protein
MDVRESREALQPIRDQFQLRFYRWAREDSAREFREGFPFVRAIRNPTSLRFLEFVARLSEVERRALSSALVKRAHQRGVELSQDFPTADEDGILELYQRYSRIGERPAARSLKRSDQAALRRVLRNKLPPVMGVPADVSHNREVWTFHKEIGCWTIRTWIDTGGRRLLEYSHSINAHDSVPLHDNTSVLSWLGITHSRWSGSENSNAAEISECVIDAYLHFTSAASKLLNELSHSLPEPQVRRWRSLVTVTGSRTNGMTIVILDSPELRKTMRGVAKWEVPTSIIPERLRAVGSHFTIVQDPAFTRQSGDLIATNSTYKHVKIEL